MLRHPIWIGVPLALIFLMWLACTDVPSTAPIPGADAGDSNGLPRIVVAASTGNTSVDVIYSKPMADSALDPSNYAIVQQNVHSEVGALLVMDNHCDDRSTNAGESCNTNGDCDEGLCQLNSPRFRGPNRTGVTLTTTSQNEVTYTLTVVNVQDESGNELAAPELLVNPSQASFSGTPPAEGDIVDSDGDGVPDNSEISGRVVVVVLSNGDVARWEVSSDPFSPDTDQDGLDDGVERRVNTDPRSTDTDADQISDFDESSIWFSSPIHQDTDADGIDDYSEIILYKTSALLSDSDGDQISDAEEVLVGNLDPRIADLPGQRIKVGNISLTLDTRITYTDTEGRQESTTTSEGTTLSRGESETFSTSDTDTIGATTQNASKLGVEVSSPKGGKVSGETQVTVGLSAENATNVSNSSVESSEEAFQRSLQGSTSLEAISQVTTEIVDATVKVDVTVENIGNTAFSLSNLELTALVQNPRDRREFLAVASLTPENEDLDMINLGPLIAERGPFVFSANEVFVSQVQQLMKNPAGMLIKVANFDINDESERNFAFTSQEIFRRTAGIVIDFGDGTVQRARVSTNSTFNPMTGKPNGISMRYVLEDILGLVKGADEGYDTTGVDLDADGIPDVDILTRVRNVETFEADDIKTNDVDERRRFWVVFSNEDFDTKINFDDLQINSGVEISLAFVQDKDDDGVFAREEFLYGSSDRNKNTDGCPDAGADGDVGTDDDQCEIERVDCLGDFEEIRDGWQVEIEGRIPFHSYPDPVQPDSDGDGLLDHEERCYRTDPRQRDTDLDGISDFEEIRGFSVDGRDSLLVYTVPTYSGEVVLDGGNGVAESTQEGNDEQVESLNSMIPSGSIIIAGSGDGIDGSTGVGGDDFIAAYHFVSCDDTVCANFIDGCPDISCASGFATNPLDPDTDGDGILDGAERDIAEDQGRDGEFINPNNTVDGGKFRDADRDGVADLLEEQGFETVINGQVITVTSDKFDSDSDDDSLPDLLEHFLGSNPNSPDSDGDGLSDLDEFKEGESCITSDSPGTICGSFATDYAKFLNECDVAETCFYADGDAATLGSRTEGTNITEADTDGDQLTDLFELDTGWQLDSTGPQVFPNPFMPNSDTDLIDDYEEWLATTDPNDEDTDDDGANDDLEVLPSNARCANGIIDDPSQFGKCRDPFVADQKIRVTFVALRVGGNDCDSGINNPGDFYYGINLRVAGSTTLYPVVVSSDFSDRIASCSNAPDPSIDEINSNNGTSFNVWREFIMLQSGDTFRVEGYIQELDSGLLGNCTADGTWNIDMTFDNSDLPVQSSIHIFNNGTGCFDDDELEIRIDRS